MCKNLEIYNSVREVPAEALKPIVGGRLKGMSDINPVWRIKKLTEQFGPVGLGWYYKITNKWLEKGSKDQIVAFVDVDLFVKYDKEWSMAIPGTGGSMFVASESSGLYTSDECFKMALTDALSVACKALGIGADVYFAKDKSKYDSNAQQQPDEKKKNDDVAPLNNIIDYPKRITDLLMSLANQNKDEAINLLEKYTAWTNTEGKEIKGKRTMKGMSEGALKATYGKVKKAYEESKLKEAV